MVQEGRRSVQDLRVWYPASMRSSRSEWKEAVRSVHVGYAALQAAPCALTRMATARSSELMVTSAFHRRIVDVAQMNDTHGDIKQCVSHIIDGERICDVKCPDNDMAQFADIVGSSRLD